MIDFRYHLVTLVAVFLALGLGLLLGTSVVAPATVDALEARLNGLRASLRETRADASAMRAERDQAREGLALAARWALRGQLAGRRVVFVSDGAQAPFADRVRSAVGEAGGEAAGTLTLTERWELSGSSDAAQLTGLVREVVAGFEPGDDAARAALTLLGRRFADPAGQGLVRRLVAAGYLELSGAAADAPWPPPDSLVVALASDTPPNSPEAGWLAALARAAAEVAPVAVVAGRPEGHSAVSVIRSEGRGGPRLATFDSAEQDSVGGPAAVLALVAAAHGRGGDFGRAPGLRLLPPPP